MVFNRIINIIGNYFNGNAHSSIREQVKREYKEIHEVILLASSLTQLLQSRKRIREYHQYLIECELESWGRPHIIELTRIWTIKYKQWKRRLRGT